MQGKVENVLTSVLKWWTDRILKEITILETACKENKSLKMFPLTFDLDPQGDISAQLVLNHLTALEDNMPLYFLHIPVDKYDWVRNTYVSSSESTTDLWSISWERRTAGGNSVV